MILTLDDFEAIAKKRLPRSLYAFADNGSERGTSALANLRSYAKWAFVPRNLIDVSAITQEVSLFGASYSSPFGIAPMGGCALFAHRADLALAEAAHAQRIPYVLSAASSVQLEEVMERAPNSWYQGYVAGDESAISVLLDRLIAARVGVLVLTVDVPVASNRDREKRLGFSVPLRPTLSLAIDGVMHPRWTVQTLLKTLHKDGIPTLPNFTGAKIGRPIISKPLPAARSGRNRFTWEHVAFVRRHWPGVLVLKGILSASDANRAIQAGVDGLIVSNHGGRQLDGALTPLDVLSDILEEAGGRPVCLDGGVRRGTDVLKARALGANVAFVGRPMLYAATSGGQRHVELAIKILSEEIACSLALLGCPDLDKLTRDFVRPV